MEKSVHEPMAWAHIEGEFIEFETGKEECEECEYYKTAGEAFHSTPHHQRNNGLG
jgi:hypothetical protein